jgi:hypothetical protein
MSAPRGGGFEIDDSELRTLQIDLREAPGRSQRGARKTLADSGDMVDTEMQRDARGHRYLPRLPKSVSHGFVGLLTMEIGLGPIPRTQGRLAHIIVYGSVNNAPVYDHTAGLRRAEPRILEKFGQMGEDATLGSREV